MSLDKKITRLQERILTLKLNEPYHPDLHKLLQELDKLDEQKRAKRHTTE
jgi:hypothetical protein